MPDGDDVFTESVETSWLGRLAGSFVAALIGLVLFLASFAVLYWNEGRAVAAISALEAGAHAVISVPADRIDAGNNGRLVHVTGMAAAGGRLTDPSFHVGGPGLLRLRRHVEMFQWQEHEESRTEKRVGGGETKTTSYSYTKEWSDKPVASARFKRAEGHANPAMLLQGVVYNSDQARLGAFALDASLVGQVDAFKALAATGAEVAGVNPPFRRVGEEFYHGASPDTPEVGDIRVRFEMVPLQNFSVVAAQINGALAPFQGRSDRVINLIEPGIHSADQMFRDAKASENELTWILRAVGFLMMLFGLALAASPIAWLASLLPFLEDVVDVAALLLALMLSIPLTLATIAIAWMAHRPLIGGGLILAGVLLAFLVRRLAPSRGRRPGSGSQAPA